MTTTTFPVDFKCAVSKEKLVKAGLEYKGPPDKVQCRKCGGQWYGWQARHDPMAIHKEDFPKCPFVVAAAAAAASTTAIATNTASNTARVVDIIKRLGYEEKDVLLAVYACQQRQSCGEVMSLDAYIGDILDELATYEGGGVAADMTPLVQPSPPTSQPSTSPITTAADETNEEVCKICRNACAEVLLLTCRHVCCCEPCVKKKPTG
jgi:hypothetical protein